jgi:twitching motility protein PilT
MPKQVDVLFGRLAVKNNLVNEGQVRECMALLERAGNGQSLGVVLVKKGYLSEQHYKALSERVKKLGAGNGEAGSAADSFVRKISTVVDVEQRDFSHLSGKPIDAYLEEARRLGASDFHFQVDSPPFVRLHGQIVYLKHPVLTPQDTAPRIFSLLNEYEKTTLREHKEVDFCYEASHGRYRSNACRQRKGLDAVFRVIPSEVPTLKSLHLPSVLERFTEYRHGMVLLTGPAGCGKTATMAALVDLINQKRQDHIVVLEEPIEYIIPSKSCNVNQRHVRVHTESFASALRSAMRADPDYICVGEMRDLETVSMAITAAETGHLVFGTLHTTNAMRSVDRIVDVFPPKEQEQIRSMVSESLRGVVSQQLIPRADGHGREPALEVLFANSAVSNMIRERKTFQLASVLQTGSREGMLTMDDSIMELFKRKLITRELAAYHAESPDRFRKTEAPTRRR